MSKRIYNFPKVGFTECPNLLWQLGIYEQRYSSLPELFRQIIILPIFAQNMEYTHRQ